MKTLATDNLNLTTFPSNWFDSFYDDTTELHRNIAQDVRASWDELPVGILDLNSRFRATWVNRKALELLCVPDRSRILGHSISTFFPLSYQKLQQALKNVSFEEGAHDLVESSLPAQDCVMIQLSRIPRHFAIDGYRLVLLEWGRRGKWFELPPEAFYKRYEISRREREVVELLLAGYRAKDIGDRLCISMSTVKKHITTVYFKTDSHSRIELIRLIRTWAPKSTIFE